MDDADGSTTRMISEPGTTAATTRRSAGRSGGAPVPSSGFGPFLVTIVGLLLVVTVAPGVGQEGERDLFATSDRCMACHNDLVAPVGDDVSIGVEWRSSMMANAARDPYWQAAIRREVLDHPAAAAAIQDECSKCHMPMMRTAAHAVGAEGRVFVHMPFGIDGGAGGSAAAGAGGIVAEGTGDDVARRLAEDGVSCTMCHQIRDEGLGSEESFVGGYVVDVSGGGAGDVAAAGSRAIFGPFDVEPGRERIMRSATGFRPVEAGHVQSSELCATCHTLYTHALGPDGEVVGELPEQVPYLEWRHSAFQGKRSCQSCHMPVADGAVAVSSVWGEPRDGFSRHAFRGGNFLVPKMLARYRDVLGVEASPRELANAAAETVDNLRRRAATIAIEDVRLAAGKLVADVSVANLAGHKLPTAYPSRRVWLHLRVADRDGRVLFESGGLEASGMIRGNDNDADPRRFEPHRAEIEREDQVQIYEAIMVDPDGRVTTGLLRAVRFVKDNRVLPRGFDKATADEDIAVRGGATGDEDFTDGGDRVRYRIDVTGAEGPFRIDVELRYQPIAYRWAHNLEGWRAVETDRFVGFWKSMSSSSSVVLARATSTVP